MKIICLSRDHTLEINKELEEYKKGPSPSEIIPIDKLKPEDTFKSASPEVSEKIRDFKFKEEYIAYVYDPQLDVLGLSCPSLTFKSIKELENKMDAKFGNILSLRNFYIFLKSLEDPTGGEPWIFVNPMIEEYSKTRVIEWARSKKQAQDKFIERCNWGGFCSECKQCRILEKPPQKPYRPYVGDLLNFNVN